MPTLVLKPTEAYLEAASPALHSPMIVGDPLTVWNDGSDETYAWADNTTSYVRGIYPRWDDPIHGLPTLDPMSVTAIEVRVRLMSESANWFGFELDGNAGKDLAYSSGYSINTAAGWTDFSWIVADYQWRTAGWAPDKIQSALAQTYIYPRFWPVTDGSGGTFATDGHLQISDQAVVLWYDEIPPSVLPFLRRTVPLRQFPRDDGRQTATARRNFPPPKSIQSSNRRGGGYL